MVLGRYKWMTKSKGNRSPDRSVWHSAAPSGMEVKHKQQNAVFPTSSWGCTTFWCRPKTTLHFLSHLFRFWFPWLSCLHVLIGHLSGEAALSLAWAQQAEEWGWRNVNTWHLLSFVLAAPLLSFSFFHTYTCFPALLKLIQLQVGWPNNVSSILARIWKIQRGCCAIHNYARKTSRIQDHPGL